MATSLRGTRRSEIGKYVSPESITDIRTDLRVVREELEEMKDLWPEMAGSQDSYQRKVLLALDCLFNADTLLNAAETELMLDVGYYTYDPDDGCGSGCEEEEDE